MSTVVDPTSDRAKWQAEEARERLVQEHFDAGARGAALLSPAPAPYRPLSPQVIARIMEQMKMMFAPGDPSERLTAREREILSAWQVEADKNWNNAGTRVRPNDRRHRVGLDRPGVAIITEHRPRVGDGSDVCFHPSNGQYCPPWPGGLPENYVPHPVVLPGCHWPLDRGEEDLARVRWAPGRTTVWVSPGQPEPE